MDECALLAKLEGVRKANSGGYLALCPAHDDHTASLSIAEGHDGRILLHCWAGCETADVLRALGLRWVDLFALRPQMSRRRLRTSPRFSRRS